jgi:hypothetical protein
MMTLKISVRCNSSKGLSYPRTNDLHPAEIEEIDESQIIFEDNADDYFELYDNEDLVVILPYDGDMDDRILEEMKPRFVVMYEPNPSFIRRVEVSLAICVANSGLSSFSSLAPCQSLLFVLCQLGGGTEISFGCAKRKGRVYSTDP